MKQRHRMFTGTHASPMKSKNRFYLLLLALCLPLSLLPIFDFYGMRGYMMLSSMLAVPLFFELTCFALAFHFAKTPRKGVLVFSFVYIPAAFLATNFYMTFFIMGIRDHAVVFSLAFFQYFSVFSFPIFFAMAIDAYKNMRRRARPEPNPPQ